MSTLSPLSSHQTSGEQTVADDTGATSLVTLVQKQLAALEALASEGQAEADALQGEVANLVARLNAVLARVSKLEATLDNHARLLGAISAGLREVPNAPVPPRSAAAPTASNGLHVADDRPSPAAAAPDPPPAPVAPQPAPRPATPERPKSAPVAASTPPAPRTQELPAAVTDERPQPQRPPAREERTAPAAAPPTANAPQERAAPAATAPPAREERPAPAVAAPPPASPPARPAPQPAPVDDGRPRVQRGTTVEVAFEDDSTETYTIVRPDEADRVRNLISETSPLGMALIGAAVGDVRSYRVRANSPELTVRVRSIA